MLPDFIETVQSSKLYTYGLSMLLALCKQTWLRYLFTSVVCQIDKNFHLKYRP